MKHKSHPAVSWSSRDSFNPHLHRNGLVKTDQLPNSSSWHHQLPSEITGSFCRVNRPDECNAGYQMLEIGKTCRILKHLTQQVDSETSGAAFSS